MHEILISIVHSTLTDLLLDLRLTIARYDRENGVRQLRCDPIVT
jgi:hypothetical protein